MTPLGKEKPSIEEYLTINSLKYEFYLFNSFPS